VSSLRVAVGSAFAIALIAVGCGSHSSAPKKFDGKTYSAPEIASRFQAVTGYTLQTQAYRAGWTTLTPSPQAESNPSYGVFSVSAVARPAMLRVLTSDRSGQVKPDSHGIYWLRAPAFKSVPAGWSAEKVFGNLVLAVPASARVLPARFTTLERFLSTLGSPVSAVRAALPQAPRFAGAFVGASQVRERFYGLTGVTLVANGPHISGQDLTPDPAEGTQAYDRFGTFDLNVMDTPDGVRQQIALLGRAKPDAHGIYWTFDPKVGGGWTATRVYGNLVVSELIGPRRISARFARLEGVLSRLLVPGAIARGNPPAPPEACSAAGIGPVGRREGVCMLGHTRVTVVNRGRVLRLHGYTATVVGVATRARLREPSAQTARARRTFFIVTIRLSNTAASPISVPDADVLVGPRVFKTDDAALPALLSRLRQGALPLRVGHSLTVGIPFQMAPSVARLARRSGVIVFPADQGQTVAGSFAGGMSRLSG
jgi:hypothetical protein